MLTHEAAQRLLDALLTTCQARGWIKARGTQRSDSTPVLAAIRTWPRLEGVLEARYWGLNQLSDVAPAWVPQPVPLDGSPRDGLRSDPTRLPKDASTREGLARQIGADGYQLLAGVRLPERPSGLCDLPALAALRQIWRQQYDRCPVPGLDALRGRTGAAQLPAAVRITSPDDLEARYCSKRAPHGVGDTLHLTET